MPRIQRQEIFRGKSASAHHSSASSIILRFALIASRIQPHFYHPSPTIAGDYILCQKVHVQTHDLDFQLVQPCFHAPVAMTIIEGFLSSILGFLKAKDAAQLQIFLQVEPPLPAEYLQLSQELKSTWSDSKKLEQHIERLLPFNDDDKAEEGGSWPGFLTFIQEYLEFWKDADFDDLVHTHVKLSALIV